ncbi:MAG TPA: adenylate/guanylate cyclase domain-containing protein [Solirubrobacteraceae bacterium]|jgi:predicted ATPase/class 3 adenylate cyclase|nr:adenylate/guanylate cyclase domain-containing protein [Solirubrobacteraceae bacterium]
MAKPRAQELPTGTVTLLFTDIEGSTKLVRELGEGYEVLLDEHHRLLRGVWAGHDGVEVDTEGDAFFVAFTSAPAAVRAAGAAQTALAAHAWSHGGQVRVRMGLHTGEVMVHDGTYMGIDVHYAARLCAAAHGGQVLVSAATRGLAPDVTVEDLGEHAVKDFPAARPIYHLVVDGRRSAGFPPPRTLQMTRTNLPSIPTPLVGRDGELAALRARLTEPGVRLVTLTGLGGTGKTRLAIAAGSELVADFTDGVFLVALAPVTSPAEVAAAVADALGASRQGELGPEAAAIEHLRGRSILMVLDNCEHVLDAAPVIGRLLEAAPEVRILATSQAPLRLSAETVMPLEALALPPAEAIEAHTLARAPAVEMFTERARAADSSFALTPANAGDVAELCRALEGLPLALELAAARVRVGGPSALLGALRRGSDALGRGARDLPERQRGTRAALEFTVALLGETERRLFAGLGAFASAWTVEQAEAMFGSELDTWESMASLIDFSLVRTRGDGRLTMAERVRRHARELLAASGEEPELRARHAAVMAETAEALMYEVMLDINGATARTRDLLPELELAIDWSRAADPATHRRLMAGVARPFYFVARLPRIAGEITAMAQAEDGSDVIAGRIFAAQAMVGLLSEGIDVSIQWASMTVECHRRTAARAELVLALQLLGHDLVMSERADEALALMEEAAALAAAEPDRRLHDLVDGELAFVALAHGDYDDAERRLREIMSRPERTDFAAHAATSYWADCAFALGEFTAAIERYASSLRELRGHDPNNCVSQLVGIAASLAGLGRDDEAAEAVGSIESASEQLGMAWEVAFHQSMVGRAVAAARERADPARWADAELRGRRRDLEEAIDWAFDLTAVTAEISDSGH